MRPAPTMSMAAGSEKGRLWLNCGMAKAAPVIISVAINKKIKIFSFILRSLLTCILSLFGRVFLFNSRVHPYRASDMPVVGEKNKPMI